MHMRHMGSTSALVIALIVTAMLVSGCTGGSTGDHAAHTTALTTEHEALTAARNHSAAATNAAEQADRVAENRARLVAALRRLWRQRATVARTERRTRRLDRETVVEVSGSSSFDICATYRSHRGNTAHRRALLERALQRDRALYYLNLSCPSS
ncbi:MAG: hypothetical protein ACLPVY_22300 [Acidimicrobiia bacterium]